MGNMYPNMAGLTYSFNIKAQHKDNNNIYY